MRRYAIGAALLLAAGHMLESEAGQHWLRGNELAESCGTTQEQSSALCIGYVIGVADTMSDAGWNADAPTVKACIPQGVVVGQLVGVVRKYLADHPEQLHAQAMHLVVFALVKAFPCSTR
jgi:hypothetical protein